MIVDLEADDLVGAAIVLMRGVVVAVNVAAGGQRDGSSVVFVPDFLGKVKKAEDLEGHVRHRVAVVHDPSAGDTSAPGFSHFAAHVESLADTMARLAAAGIRTEPASTPGADLHTTPVTDPDGRAIELVQWPPGHPDGLTANDWSDGAEPG